MPNLLVEIGNTALKAAWSDGMTLGKTFRYQGEKMFEFVHSLVEKEKPAVMVISSTIEVNSSQEEMLSTRCGKLIILDRKHVETIARYSVPEYLSPDRAASVIGARYLFKGKGCIVFDFGTTLTIDVTDEEGNYLGGNISLGCRTRFKALNRYSRTLPLVDTPVNVRETGNSQKSSIESGVVSGIMFEIQGYLSLFPEKVVVLRAETLYILQKE